MTSDRGNPANVVVGAILVLVGAVLLLQRSGLVHWATTVHLWPVLLMGFGIAKLVETSNRRPRHGYIPLLLGAWLLMGDLGWIVLRESWPYLLIGYGLTIILDVLWVPRVPTADATLGGRAWPWVSTPANAESGPLKLFGILLAVSLVASAGQFRAVTRAESSTQPRTFSFMGRTVETSTAPQITGGEVTTIMGSSDLDLRATSTASEGGVTINVVTVWGQTTLRVPSDWTIEIETKAIGGEVRDRRPHAAPPLGPPPATTPPRLILRGLVMMGGLTIRS